jgi:hypothetical protein
LGIGTTGGATATPTSSIASPTTYGGTAGSGGTAGANVTMSTPAYTPGGIAGLYGGGSGGMGITSQLQAGGDGAVRIIWGPGRAFPSTLTTDQ